MTEVQQTPFGYYFCGKVEGKINGISAREISELNFFDKLPDRHLLSFKDDYELFNDLLNIVQKKKRK